ncbi:phosphotransferase [Bacteroidota bacterium]
MRISLLEKREDFYKILAETLREWKHIEPTQEGNSSTFHINRYLNFIAHIKLNSKVFAILKNEYFNSLSVWKRIIQRIYVSLAIHKSCRKLFAHKKITLPTCYQSYLILGGNHRLRLFPAGLEYSYVVLKKGESLHFIKNETLLKKEMNPDYAPELLNSGQNWIQEEYFEGTPLNRIFDDNLINDVVKRLISKHLNELLIPASKTIPANEYLNQIQSTCATITNNDKHRIKTETKTTIEKTLELCIAKYLSNEPVPVTWSHGDFQMANVLVNDNTFKVIDWEAADKRFIYYDLFVFLGEMRVHGSFEKALTLFEGQIQNYSLSTDLPPQWKLLLALEELLFMLNEDCSVNFYHSGERALKLCADIKKTGIV